ncbi:MAG: glycosyltransferase [Ferruginibacter sp.]
MKIIHVLNHFLPDHIAGTEMYVYNLINSLQDMGVEGIVLIPGYGHAQNREYFYETVRVIQYAEPSIVDRNLIMGKRDPEGLAFFTGILEDERPDIVHYHELAGSNGITYRHVKGSKLSGFKNIMTFHLSGYSCKTGNLMYRDEQFCDGVIRIGRCSDCYNKVNRKDSLASLLTYPLSRVLYSLGINSTQWNSRIGTALGLPFIIKKLQTDLLQLFDNCDAIVVLTEWYRNILIKNDLPSEKIHHISQGLTVQTPAGAESTAGSEKRLKIIFIGRIAHFKGLHILLEALKYIDPQRLSLDIYGTDPHDEYSEGLRSFSAEMKNVNWKGPIPPGNVVSVIGHYDMLCLPSAFSEMSPLVIQEAFAVQVPVLASDVYGNAEQIQDGENGWLFRFKDAGDLQLKLEGLCDDPALVLQARSNIKRVKPFAAVADEQLVVYRKISAAN